MTNFKSISALMISLAATACIGDESQLDDDETLETTTQELTSYVTGTWTNPQGPVPLADASTHFCYLSKLTGAFYGGGEWVDVYASNGRWYVWGGSLQGPLSATATCVNYTAFSNVAYGWITASTPVTSNNTSYVTGLYDIAWISSLRGELKGGGEYASVDESGGSWYVHANALSGTGVTGRAVSARLRTATHADRIPSYFGPVTQMAPLDGHTVDNPDQDLGPTSDRICYLTKIGGALKGYGEYVEVKRSGGRWWLHAEADRWNSGVTGTARCVSLY